MMLTQITPELWLVTEHIHGFKIQAEDHIKVWDGVDCEDYYSIRDPELIKAFKNQFLGR